MRVRLRKWEEIRPVRGNAEVLLQMWAENQHGVCINSKGNVHILYAFKDDFSVWSYCYSAYSGLKRGSKQVTRQATKTWLSGIFLWKIILILSRIDFMLLELLKLRVWNIWVVCSAQKGWMDRPITPLAALDLSGCCKPAAAYAEGVGKQKAGSYSEDAPLQ